MWYPKNNSMEASKSIKIFTDGGSRGNPGPGASAFVVFKDDEVVFEKGYFFKRTTNNIAEYFAVLMAVNWLVNKYPKDVCAEFFLDSELVVKQLNGEYKIKNEKLKNIYEKIMTTKKEINCKLSFTHIPREKNIIADALVNRTVDENL